jgi:septal ring factor EnvC (AmiA/AmiB activator)
MKLPITFEQFKSDPLKALFFAALVAMTALYVDSRKAQMAKATEVCEKRLQMCEAKLDKLTKQLKTQDSLCSALVTEITIYKTLGKI